MRIIDHPLRHIQWEMWCSEDEASVIEQALDAAIDDPRGFDHKERAILQRLKDAMVRSSS